MDMTLIIMLRLILPVVFTCVFKNVINISANMTLEETAGFLHFILSTPTYLHKSEEK